DRAAAWRPALTLAGRTGPGGSDVRLHPRGASPATLRDALARVGLDGPLVGATATLLLPAGTAASAVPAARVGAGAAGAGAAAGEEVEPLPSPAARAAAGPRATGLRPWRVGGLRVGLAAALPWLAGLAADESARPDGPALGAGLRFWA